ncbi:MAG: hypothetical protein EOP49_09490 [Sphingobacteriales bacterium]|nr:MAG: hypothetical protein EOP49_09490 [Sphingobacteriales bacterium]
MRALKRILLSLAILLPTLLQAQTHHEIGLFAGVSNYYGDMQDKWFPQNGYKPNVGVIYKYFMHPRIGLRFGANYTRLTAADSLSDIPVKKLRNLRFETGLFEVHGGIELNLLAVDWNRAKVSPYVFAGIAAFYTNPYTDGLAGEKVYLRPLSTEGQGIPDYPDRKQYSLVNMAFPIGGGMKFFIGKTLMITTEMGFRYTSTDYIDDVSRSYIDQNILFDYRSQQAVDLSFRTDELPEWTGEYPDYGFQRGDSKKNDWYWFGGISVALYLDAFGNLREYWQANCPNMFK